MKKPLLILILLLAVAGLFVLPSLTRRTPVPPSAAVLRAQRDPIRRPVPPADQETPAASTITDPVLADELARLQISDAVKTIVGLNDKRDFTACIKALRALNRRLTADDTKALLLFLNTAATLNPGLDASDLHAIKNDVINVIIRQDTIPPDLWPRMAAMYQNKAHDPVWRDYCVQYMSDYYLHHPAARADADPVANQLRSNYWSAVTEKQTTLAGTALLSLERLSRTNPDYDRAKVSETALALASDDASCEAVRITALRLCATLNQTNILSTARIVAQTGETTTLRMAALATLGDIGDAQDVELLKSMTTNPEKRIVTIAEAALKRLQTRLDATNSTTNAIGPMTSQEKQRIKQEHPEGVQVQSPA